MALRQRRSVLIDRTNIDKGQRSHWLEIAREYSVPKAAIAAVFLNVHIDTCKARVMSRRGHPTLKRELKSLEIVDKFFFGLHLPEENEGFGHVVVLQEEELLKLNINDMVALEGVSGPANTPKGGVGLAMAPVSRWGPPP